MGKQRAIKINIQKQREQDAVEGGQEEGDENEGKFENFGVDHFEDMFNDFDDDDEFLKKQEEEAKQQKKAAMKKTATKPK